MCKFIIFCALSLFSFASPETELVALVNQERQNAGLSTLAINWEVARLARYRTEEMQTLGFFGHDSKLYNAPDEMLIRFGVEFCQAGVSIAKGQNTAADVFAAWFASAEHREKLLNPNFTSAGVGLTYSADGTPYWALMLISCANSGTSGSEGALRLVLRSCDNMAARSSL